MNKSQLNVIPDGLYCYSRDEQGNQINCPHWGKNPDKPVQQDGFCTLLDVADWDDSDVFPLLWDQVKHPDCPSNHDIGDTYTAKKLKNYFKNPEM